MNERRDRFDAELAELFGDDPELLGLAHQVRESRPDPELDPRFAAVLRARLMNEAERALAARRRFRFAPGGLAAWGTLAAGVALVAAAVVAVVSRVPSSGLAVVASNVSHRQAVDPHQAITLSFNEPMDEQSVVAALKIEPATQVTVTWVDAETLVVTPTHPLATDTDYQVTIPKATVRSQSGQLLASTVTIDFGTKPASTPSPTALPAPALQLAAVGPAAAGAQAFWGPAGAPGVTASSAVEATGVASPSATASASPVEGAVVFPPGKSAVALSESPAATVEVAPNGFNVALAVVTPDGNAEIVVENADGSQPTQVWPVGSTVGTPVTTLAWDGSNRIVFVTPQGIDAVDLTNEQWTQLYAFPAGGSASGVVLAADGQYAFLPAADLPASPVTSTPASPTVASSSASPSVSAAAAPGSAGSPYVPTAADGGMLRLAGGAGQVPPATQLPGSVSGVVGFSGAGDEIAWVDASGSGSTVLEAPTTDPTAITPVSDAPGAGIAELALDSHGATIAYGLDPGGIEVETSAGLVLGTSPDEAGSLAFSPDGTQLAVVAAGGLDVAPVQAASTSAATSVCAGAEQVLSQFVDAQAAHDGSALTALSAAGAPPAATATPAAVDRGYVISFGCAAATAAGGPILTASARLIVDPTGSSRGQLTDETVVLGQSDGEWLVTGLSVPPLSAQGSGPHVLSVAVTPPSAGSSSPETVVTVTFDSDLDAPSVSATSLWLETAGGGASIPLLSPPTYDSDTREATLTVASTLPAGTEVVVGTAMSDIDGGHPPAVSFYPVGG